MGIQFHNFSILGFAVLKRQCSLTVISVTLTFILRVGDEVGLKRALTEEQRTTSAGIVLHPEGRVEYNAEQETHYVE